VSLRRAEGPARATSPASQCLHEHCRLFSPTRFHEDPEMIVDRLTCTLSGRGASQVPARLAATRRPADAPGAAVRGGSRRVIRMESGILRVTAFVLFASALSGCVAATLPGTQYELVERAQARGLRSCIASSDSEPGTCNVVRTGDAADNEAWMFEARLRVVVNFIPFGREPVDHIVVGTREQCEATRAAFRSRPHVAYGEETPPTEPCKGPLYFRKIESGPTK